MSAYFEGGVRSASFVSGGSPLIPASSRGTVFDGLAHLADWYSIFCLVTPWARLVSDWGHQGLCLRVLGAHFGHIFAHILHARWGAGHHGVNFRNSDLAEVRVRSIQPKLLR
jgi:hypothetical protein